MANSPGPSSSNNTGKVDPLVTKKKRLRPKKSKKTADPIVDIKLAISVPPEPLGVCYRHRESGPIRLNTFSTDSNVPYVFFTGSKDKPEDKASSSTEVVTETAKEVQAADKTPKKKRKRPANKKTKKVEVFSPYISEDETKLGLLSGLLIKGFIRINHKQPIKSYVGNEDASKIDYEICSVLERNRALEGDEVLIQLKNGPDSPKNSAKVVYICQRVHPRTAVGFLSPLENNKDYALFTPRDCRIPKMKIPKISWPSSFESHPDLYEEILFIAQLTDWSEVQFASGTIIENLGISGDLKIESLAILRQFLLDATPYSDKICQNLPIMSTVIDSTELEYRLDLRKECIFTIDPLTARDLDDAVSCQKLSNGNYRVGVHIADVAFFLKEGTDLDELVRQKATTIYMVDVAYHMLPLQLCQHCSLLPNQDKLAFSIIWELTPSGDIINQEIARSVINSCTQFAYEHAQLIIDEPQHDFQIHELPTIYNGFSVSDIVNTVKDLHKIALCLREKRRLNGSLKISQVKLSFDLEPTTGEPRNFSVYENQESHRLIEEFMLLANMKIADFINDNFPDLAFLRLHEPPKLSMMNDLRKFMETLGIHLDITSSGTIQKSLDKYNTSDFLSQTRMAVLNHLLTKPMKRARYFCAGANDATNLKHYALSLPIYTHFTSPIRRYADIMVHRLLAASLDYNDVPKLRPDDVSKIAETCNVQKYNAKRAGDASSDLYLAHYVENHAPFIEAAVVLEAKERSLDLIVLKTGNVVRLHSNTLSENIKWEAEEIPSFEKEKKAWKILVTFLENGVSRILETFSLVQIELKRIPKTNKLEANLIKILDKF